MTGREEEIFVYDLSRPKKPKINLCLRYQNWISVESRIGFKSWRISLKQVIQSRSPYRFLLTQHFSLPFEYQRFHPSHFKSLKCSQCPAGYMRLTVNTRLNDHLHANNGNSSERIAYARHLPASGHSSLNIEIALFHSFPGERVLNFLEGNRDYFHWTMTFFV